MPLSEFGWKLCATAVLCMVASFLGSISTVFIGDRWGLGFPFAIVMVVSPYVAVLGVALAIIGHVLTWRRHRQTRTAAKSN